MNENLIGDRSPGEAADSERPSTPIPTGTPDPPVWGSDEAIDGTPEAPADLAPNHLPLEPRFPLEVRGTRIVLAGGTAGYLRAFWHLDRDDFEYAASSFPAAGVRPVAVIRLRRGHWGDDGETVAELALSPGVRHGAGEVPFETPRDHSRYHAELGLATPQGGWLMLTRSNRLYDTDGVGLDLPERLETVDGRVLVDPDPIDRAEVAQIQSQLPAETAPEALVFPLAMPARGWRRVCAAAPEGILAPGALVELIWRDSDVSDSDIEPALALGPRVAPTDGGRSLGLPAPVQHQIDALAMPGAVIAMASVETRGLDHALDESRIDRSRIDQATTGPGRRAGEQGGEKGGEKGGEPGSIAPLTYGSPPERPSRPRIEAELRIMGSAAPNETLDLFGFPYRVGPGGRFQFVLSVDDPELLARALAGRPPEALLRPKD